MKGFVMLVVLMKGMEVREEGPIVGAYDRILQEP